MRILERRKRLISFIIVLLIITGVILYIYTSSYLLNSSPPSNEPEVFDEELFEKLDLWKKMYYFTPHSRLYDIIYENVSRSLEDFVDQVSRIIEEYNETSTNMNDVDAKLYNSLIEWYESYTYYRDKNVSSYYKITALNNIYALTLYFKYELLNGSGREKFIDELNTLLNYSQNLFEQVKREIMIIYGNISLFIATNNLSLVIIYEDIYDHLKEIIRNYRYISIPSLEDEKFFKATLINIGSKSFDILYVYPVVKDLIFGENGLLNKNITITKCYITIEYIIEQIDTYIDKIRYYVEKLNETMNKIYGEYSIDPELEYVVRISITDLNSTIYRRSNYTLIKTYYKLYTEHIWAEVFYKALNKLYELYRYNKTPSYSEINEYMNKTLNKMINTVKKVMKIINYPEIITRIYTMPPPLYSFIKGSFKQGLIENEIDLRRHLYITVFAIYKYYESLEQSFPELNIIC